MLLDADAIGAMQHNHSPAGIAELPRLGPSPPHRMGIMPAVPLSLRLTAIAATGTRRPARAISVQLALVMSGQPQRVPVPKVGCSPASWAMIGSNSQADSAFDSRHPLHPQSAA